MDITGQLIKILPEQNGSGARGPWTKQEFVIETREQYPKKACFNLWNDKIDMLRRCNMGDIIKVSFNVESREHNDRWYTELRAWKIEAGNADIPVAPAQTSNPIQPAGPTISNNDISGITFSNDNLNDDLPF